MSFTASWWLLGLVPWAAVVLWLLWGRRRRVDVPFLELWKGPVEPPRERRAFQVPPLWMAAAMVAMLLAILASSRPVVRLRAVQGPHLSIIVDRGVTMSARGQSIERFRELINASKAPIARSFGLGPVDLVVVPGAEAMQADRSNWSALAERMAPTAVDTREAVRAAAARRLGQTGGPVIVLSDAVLSIDDDRLVQISPAKAIANVGIVLMAVRDDPVGQVLVKVRNDSSLKTAVLRITSDGKPISQEQINLPEAGAVRDYFLDVSSTDLGRVVCAQIDAKDELVADNAFWLVRQTWPALENRTQIPVELKQVMDLYARRYPPSDGSKHVSVGSGLAALAINEPGAVVAMSTGDDSTRPVQNLRVASHPLTQAIDDWSALAAGGAMRPPAEGGWTQLVWAGDRVLVAIRTSPVRQVWAVHNQRWATTRQFVMFWKNVFDWLGEGDASQSAGQLGKEWSLKESADAPKDVESGFWPGVYQRNDGAMVASNAATVTVGRAQREDWRADLARASAEYAPRVRGHNATGALLLLGLAAIVLAAATWKPPQKHAIAEIAGPGERADH